MHEASPTQRRRYVGRSVRRVGDRRLVSGAGRFVDDVRLPGTLHALIVRSPHPHAVIRAIDAGAATPMPGVVAVVTGQDVASMMQPLETRPEVPPGRVLRRYPLATDRVLFTGDAVAVVVAEDPYTARDAAERVEVAYDPLPAVVDPQQALEPTAPLLYPDWDSNVAYDWTIEHGDPDGAFARAARVISLRLVNQRVYAAFVEPRAALAHVDPATGELTVWASTQVPHTLRGGIAAALGLPEHAVRVIAPDVGGAFGSKGGIYPEYVLVAALAQRLGRPVRWTETRSESFLATNHGRDQIQYLRAAVAEDGTVLGLEVDLISNLGAYNAATVATRTALMSTGPYRIQDLRTRVRGVMTNTTPTGAYRGAGRPEAAYMLERLMDAIARELKLDPADVRRRNFIPADAFPYTGATGVVYDSGDYARALDEALRRVDYARLQAEQAEARAAGRLVGIGLAVYCEFAGPGWDSATVRVLPSGAVVVTTGISPHGQGEETTFAQLVADELGIDLEAVTVRASDTAITPQGIGTFGSRGTSIGGSAVLLATRQVREKARRIAAHMLEVAEEDVIAADGQFAVRGAPDRAISFAAVARAAYAFTGAPGGLEPGLEATSYFMPQGRTFPFGAHIAVVEVDPTTGRITVTRYVAVDDCGPRINPQLVEGQVVGGLAQGLGQALQEAIIYDRSGQPLTASFLDYGPLRAAHMPTVETAHTVTPSPFNPLGVKGVGEAGTTGGPPALVNAVLDALAPLGICHLDMPLTAPRVWRAIRSASGDGGTG
ncbi:MAG: xanthine dehydrogenase family protein molybdopterin-binding subunit [Sphaerobacter sp.]|nr:xanthine dehydrogenase family protein molybdopterin-binding subunit [Sphaerobacter sp.]